MSNEYEIATLADFLKVPKEKLPECMVDFMGWLVMKRNESAICASLGAEPGQVRIDRFIWLDDGKTGELGGMNIISAETGEVLHKWRLDGDCDG
jgi:hypothetical protein